MRKRNVLSALLRLADPALCWPRALAADNGIYLGGVGRPGERRRSTIIGGVCRTTISTATTPASSSSPASARSTGSAVEASYVNFGEPEDTVLGTKLKADGDGISAFAVGFLPIGPVDLFAKVGLISLGQQDRGGTFDDDGTDLAYGVGAQFRVLEPVRARRVRESSTSSDVETSNMLSIGVTYTFL